MHCAIEHSVEEFVINGKKVIVNHDIAQTTINERIFNITPGEFKIFHELLIHPNKLLSKGYIDTKVLELKTDTRTGTVLTGSHTTYTYIKSLRSKLNALYPGTGMQWIKTRRGLGYYLDKRTVKVANRGGLFENIE